MHAYQASYSVILLVKYVYIHIANIDKYVYTYEMWTNTHIATYQIWKILTDSQKYVCILTIIIWTNMYLKQVRTWNKYVRISVYGHNYVPICNEYVDTYLPNTYHFAMMNTCHFCHKCAAMQLHIDYKYVRIKFVTI